MAKKAELYIWKEKEKYRSFSRQKSLDYHLNSLGIWNLLGAEQDPLTPKAFWICKDKPEQVPNPQ